jgi:mercuric ion transport protein
VSVKDKAPLRAGSGAAARVASAWASIAAVTAALGSACCTGPLVGPLLVAALGASGAAALAGIKPYTPYLFGASFLMLAFSFYSAYRPAAQCAPGATLQPAAKRTRFMIWLAAAVWLGALVATAVALARA